MGRPSSTERRRRARTRAQDMPPSAQSVMSTYSTLAQAWNTLQRSRYRNGDTSAAAVQEFVGAVRRAAPINEHEEIMRAIVQALLGGLDRPVGLLHGARLPAFIMWLSPDVIMRELKLEDTARLVVDENGPRLLPIRGSGEQGREAAAATAAPSRPDSRGGDSRRGSRRRRSGKGPRETAIVDDVQAIVANLRGGDFPPLPAAKAPVPTRPAEVATKAPATATEVPATSPVAAVEAAEVPAAAVPAAVEAAPAPSTAASGGTGAEHVDSLKNLGVMAHPGMLLVWDGGN